MLCLHLQFLEIAKANSRDPPLPARCHPAETKYIQYIIRLTNAELGQHYDFFMTSNYPLTHWKWVIMMIHVCV